jgi:hypothetical protein
MNLDSESSRDRLAREPADRLFAGERRILGPDGREWRVREAPMPIYDRRGARCLIFEAVDAARRVRRVPDHWYEWSDAELYALSLRP